MLNNEYKNKEIYQKADGSFIIQNDDIPYHIPNTDEYKSEYDNIIEYIKTNNIKVKHYMEISNISYDKQVKIITDERNYKLMQADNRITRYKEQLELGINTDDSSEMYRKILEYKQYLRDITKDPNYPYIEIDNHILL